MRLFSSLCLFVLVACGGDSSESSSNSNGGGSSGPVLPAGQIAFELRPSLVELGLLTPLQVVESQFEIVNIGEVPLRGLDIQGNCGCLKFQFDRTEIPVGESRTIPFTVGTGRSSMKTLSAKVAFRHGRRYQLTLNILYYAVPRLASSTSGVFFGRMEVGDEPAVQTLTVSAVLPIGTPMTPMTLEGPVDSPVVCTLGEVADEEIGGMLRRTAEVRCELDRSRPVGEVRAKLFLFADWAARTSLAIRGHVHGGIYLENPKIHFGRVKSGKSRTELVRLFYSRAEAPVVERMSCENEAFVVSSRPDPDNRAILLEIVYTPTGEGEDLAELQIWSSVAEEPLTLSLAGQER